MTRQRERFSPAAYSSKLQEEGNEDAGAVVAGADPLQDFRRLAEDMRSYLAQPRGETEEERREYNECLNRAVLGYADDRERILAVIADRLLRQRVHELPGGRRHPYATLAEALFAEVTAIIECISKGIDFPSTLIGPSQASIGYVIYISFLLARE